MDVRFVTPTGLSQHQAAEVAELLARDDGFVWVDVPTLDPATEAWLAEDLRIHPQVLDSCRQRNHVAGVFGYPDYFFFVLHAPLLGKAGHVHLLELDQIVGHRFLVTVHGPLNPILDPSTALLETESMARRIESGRLSASTPLELSYALGSAIARRQRALIGEVAEKLPGIEQDVMCSQLRDPEALLEQLFLIRHELTTACTMAAQSHNVFGRIESMATLHPQQAVDLALIHDLADQFDRVRSVGDGESQFLFGVIDLYQTKVNTKMTVAMERLAVIAAVTLPITAIASIFGMNLLGEDQRLEFAVVLAVMALMSFTLLRWARRQGWW